MAERMKILIIDDEPTVLDAVRMILMDNGFETVVASTGREGIDHEAKAYYDMVITDLRLPDMSGLDVLKAIRSKDPNSRVIIITAHSTAEVVKAARTGGAFDVLSKPFLPNELMKMVNRVLDIS